MNRGHLKINWREYAKVERREAEGKKQSTFQREREREAEILWKGTSVLRG